MMEPLERAARALCELDNNPPGATMDGKPLWRDYLPEVRAVLEAITEPSQSMVSDGAFQIFRGQRITDEDLASARRVWRRMIHAALAEGGVKQP